MTVKVKLKHTETIDAMHS